VNQSDNWYPSPEQIAQANVSEIMRRLGVSDYDELYRLSIAEQDRYWAEINAFCGIKWATPYESFADFSRGREFPRWFVGGELNWADTIFAWAKNPETAGKPALVAEREDGAVTTLSYAELFGEVRRFAGGLVKLGVRRGDRVALLMEPSREAVVSMLGISYMGAVVMPLFSGFGTESIASRLSLCRARAIVATTGFTRRGAWIDRARAVTEAANGAGTEFLILKHGTAEERFSKAIDWNRVAAGPALGPDAERMSSQDPFMLFFTSGTTGKPKGIVHTHGSFPLKVVHDAVMLFDMKQSDVFFWPADMGWIAGALIIASTMMRGATMVCYDGAPDFPDWSRMSRMIERHRVTQFGAAPTMVRGLAARSDLATAGDVSSVRLLVVGGEAIDPDHFVWFGKNFGRSVAPVVNISGGTEVSNSLVSSVMLKPIRPASFNTAVPGIDVDVVDAGGKPVRNEVGELIVRAPFVGMTNSFWEDDERYLETYWRTFEGVWVHGDLAVCRDDGSFLIRGRSDDTLMLAGKRAGPAEIEDVMTEVPEVVEAAAIGVEDAAKGQALVVFVVAPAAAAYRESLIERLLRHADERLGRAFRPKAIHVVRELPKTRTAKVMRRLIRNAYSGAPLGDTSSLENPSALQEIAGLTDRR